MQLYSNKHSTSQSKKKSKRAFTNRGETRSITSNNTVTSHLHPVSPYISPTHIQKQDRQCTYNVTLWRVRAYIVAVEKQEVWRILSACLSPSLSSMQSAGAILSYVACPALQYFSTLCHIRHHFRGGGGVIEYKKVFFDILYNFCLKHFSSQEEMSEI
jgi:hypothetical protein